MQPLHLKSGEKPIDAKFTWHDNNMTASADDYAWFPASVGELANAYCITLIRDVAPQQAMARLKGNGITTVQGVEELVQLAGSWDAGNRSLVGITEIRHWSMMVEPSGFVGVIPRHAQRLSAGTTLASHFLNVNLQDGFMFAEDGAISATVEPSIPQARRGPKADQLAEAMRSVGYDISGASEPSDHFELFAFALVEELTGFRVREADMVSATYLCGYVKVP